MLKLVRSRLTYSNVVGTLALFLVLAGGGAWAAKKLKLKPDSVLSTHIKDGEVKSSDALDNGLTGTDIDELTLDRVPDAQNAQSADTADSADTANSAVSAQSANSANTAQSAVNAQNADKVDGGDVCRTNGVLTLTSNATQTICTSGPITLTAECETTSISNTDTRIKLDTSVNDAFYSFRAPNGTITTDSDFDAADPAATLTTVSSFHGGGAQTPPVASAVTDFYVGAGTSQLSGTLGSSGQHVFASGGTCKFVVGAIG